MLPNPDIPVDQAEASPSLRFAPGPFIDHDCIIRPLGSGGMAGGFLFEVRTTIHKVGLTLLLEPDFRGRPPRWERRG